MPEMTNVLSSVTFLTFTMCNLIMSVILLINILKIIKNNSTPIYLNWLSKGLISIIIVSLLCIVFEKFTNKIIFNIIFNYFGTLTLTYILLWQSRFITYSSKLVQKSFILIMHVLNFLVFMCFMYALYAASLSNGKNVSDSDIIYNVYKIRYIFLIIGCVINILYAARALVCEKLSRTTKMLFISSITMLCFLVITVICKTMISQIFHLMSIFYYLIATYRLVISDKGRFLND